MDAKSISPAAPDGVTGQVHLIAKILVQHWVLTAVGLGYIVLAVLLAP